MDLIARREALFAAAAGAAGLGLARAAAAQVPAPKKATSPRQAWAHKDGKIALKANGAPGVRPDAWDHILINQAFARYGMGYDEGQGAVLASLFTRDAVVDVAEGAGKPFQTLSGHAAVVGNFADSFGQQGDQRRHCFTNVIVESLTETKATALAYAIVTVAADGLMLGATVIYTADLVKEGSAWRFRYLFIGMDGYAGAKPKVVSRSS